MNPHTLHCNCCNRSATYIKNKNMINSSRGLFPILQRVKKFYFLCDRCIDTNVLVVDDDGKAHLVFNIDRSKYQASEFFIDMYESDSRFIMEDNASSIQEVIGTVSDTEKKSLEQFRKERAEKRLLEHKAKKRERALNQSSSLPETLVEFQTEKSSLDLTIIEPKSKLNLSGSSLLDAIKSPDTDNSKTMEDVNGPKALPLPEDLEEMIDIGGLNSNDSNNKISEEGDSDSLDELDGMSLTNMILFSNKESRENRTFK